MKHRFTALLCTACMAISGVYAAMPAEVMTASADAIIDSGTCGDNLTWVLDDEGILTIEGTGEMYDWDSKSLAPWASDSYNSIRSVVIKDGVSSIGKYAFCGKAKLTDVEMPNSLKKIGEHSFEKTGLYQAIIPKSVDTIEDYAFYMAENLGLIYILNPDIAFEDSKYIFMNYHYTNCDFDGNWYVYEGFKGSGKIYCYEDSTAEIYENTLKQSDSKTYKYLFDFIPLDATKSYITFNVNGSESKPDLSSILTVAMGEEFTLPECNYTPPAKTRFYGWEINGKRYNPGDTITVTEQVTVLKALWKDGSALGDPTGDNKIDSKDATLILAEYASTATGGGSAMTATQKTAADVNKDTKIDSKDASAILSYYSYTATGGTDSIEDHLFPKT